MLRLLLLTTVLLVCQIKAKRSPILCRPAVLAEDRLKANSLDILKTGPLSVTDVEQALKGGPFTGGPLRGKIEKRAARIAGGATSAKAALVKADGIIIAKPVRFKRCPPFKLYNSGQPQPLCPHARELLRTFYNSGFCYVLFPYWQQKYYIRCLCRTCRTSCHVHDNSRRNYCKPERYSYTNVWAICRSGSTWRFRNVRIRLATGGCKCMSYGSRCLG